MNYASSGQDIFLTNQQGDENSSFATSSLTQHPHPQTTGLRWMMSSKIHKATVTQADVSYIGSITLDRGLMNKCGLLPGEKVLVVSNTTGARLETYIIPGKQDSGEVCLNGAAAHLIGVGHEVIIIGFQLATGTLEPKAILVNEYNQFVRYL